MSLKSLVLLKLDKNNSFFLFPSKLVNISNENFDPLSTSDYINNLSVGPSLPIKHLQIVNPSPIPSLFIPASLSKVVYSLF